MTVTALLPVARDYPVFPPCPPSCDQRDRHDPDGQIEQYYPHIVHAVTRLHERELYVRTVDHTAVNVTVERRDWADGDTPEVGVPVVVVKHTGPMNPYRHHPVTHPRFTPAEARAYAASILAAADLAERDTAEVG